MCIWGNKRQQHEGYVDAFDVFAILLNTKRIKNIKTNTVLVFMILMIWLKQQYYSEVGIKDFFFRIGFH